MVLSGGVVIIVHPISKMTPATVTTPVSFSPLCQISASNKSFFCANVIGRCPSDFQLKLALLGSSPAVLRIGSNVVSHSQRASNASVRGRIYCTSSDSFQQDYPQPQRDQAAPERTYIEQEPMDRYRQINPTMRRRPYNLEAKMRMKAYRRQAVQQRRADAMEEEARNFQLDPAECYKKGDPNTIEGVITEIIHIGCLVTLANGRDGFLPASQLGCMGGLALLERLFKVGQEITVRVIEVPHVGRDRLFLKR